jgi:hypothetical protein
MIDASLVTGGPGFLIPLGEVLDPVSGPSLIRSPSAVG